MIVCIGDSITAGQHLEDWEGAWPSHLQDGVVYAKGIPGDTTRGGLERFPRDVQSLTPQKVIVQFGHNDCNRWDSDRGLPRVSLMAFKANLIEMIDRTRAFEAVPYLCSLTPSHKSEQHAIDVIRYDRVIRGVAINENTKLIDVWGAFLDDRELIMEDGLHLTLAGHLRYAEVVRAVLR